MAYMVDTNPVKIKEIVTRSISRIYPTAEALEAALQSGRKLRIFMGIDPTATYVHLGHATNYLLLKKLHDLGHTIIVLIGDFTAMIGDPSDKNAARKRLSKEEVEENLKTFKGQIGKILDFSNQENPIEIRYNSEWLEALGFAEIVELGSHFTVQQMIERDNFSKRLKEQKPLYVHEFFYPLLQGYDSVALDADVEIGGTDQTFNMLAGRILLKDYKQKEKIVVTTTLLENPVTREKLMSKSLGTGIGLDESPREMFGKTMALPDEAIIQCFIDCTLLPLEQVAKLKDRLEKGANPRDLKMELAETIVALYYGADQAAEAREQFIQTFQKKEIPTEIPETSVLAGTALTDVLLTEKVAPSKSELRRLLQGGAIEEVNGQKITDPYFLIDRPLVLKIGKHRFLKIEIKVN